MSVILKHRQFGDSMYLWKRWVKMSQVPLHHGLDFPSGRRGEGRDALCQVWTTRRRCPPALARTDAPWATADSVAHCAVFFLAMRFTTLKQGKKPNHDIWFECIALIKQRLVIYRDLPKPGKKESVTLWRPHFYSVVIILIVYVYLYL